jgi:uncharacterized alpha-E superfamily protein
MLGRTANDLFWLSRYMERAENMARLIEVSYRIGLIPRQGGGQFEEWRSALASSGNEQRYFAKYDELNARNVIDFLLFDPENASSIHSCLMTARNNGRAQRTALTHDMWQSLNATWLEFSAIKPNDINVGTLADFLSWVKQRSALFRGTMEGTILRNDTWLFSKLGAYIERADNTARIIDVKYYVLLPEYDMIGSGVDTHQWAVILRSVSAHRSYRWVYHDTYKPWLVAEYLILNKLMPRSLAFAYEEIGDTVAELASYYDHVPNCLAQAQLTRDQLRTANMNDIFQRGLHEFLQDFTRANSALSDIIATDYHFTD